MRNLLPALLLLPSTSAAALCQTPETVLDLGPLQVEVHVSRTAHLFHVVDQISGWSPFCHDQYLRGLGPMDEEDQVLLAEHRGVRAQLGWGGGLEQTFYTALEIDEALEQGLERGFLTLDQAAIEERVLLHFAERSDALLALEEERLFAFQERIFAERELLATYAVKLARLTEVEGPLVVPAYLLANPADHDFGGGYNGGRLTLEIPRKDDPLGTFVHEIFHAFLLARQAEIERAIAAVRGGTTGPALDFQTVNEGLAHAIAPGLVHPGSATADPLVSRVRDVERRGLGLDDYQGRVYRYALALRPLLREALADDATLAFEELLVRALDVWGALTELELAREPLEAGQEPKSGD